MTDTTLVRLSEIGGRGRALVASQPLRAGQVVLRDSPILLYSALPPYLHNDSDSSPYCSHCFRLLNPPPPQSNSSSLSLSGSSPAASIVVSSCPWCSVALFCSCHCRSAALSSSHTLWVCRALEHLRKSTLIHHPDRYIQARFLLAAYNLAVVSPSNFQTLLSLQGEPSALSDDAAPILHSFVSSLCPSPEQGLSSFSVELTASLLAKDKINAFGLMEPFSPDKERSVRAYGIYPFASFFNHDCLPNACRFDYIDAVTDPRLSNTDMFVRIIHDIPQGREICLSYFPVNLKYSDRQRRLKEDYGFNCECDRCKVEANWSDQDDDDEEGLVVVDDEEVAMDEDIAEPMAVADSGTEGCSNGGNVDNDFPHAYFFLQYVCDRENCWGTLAPLPPSDATPSIVMECNLCGYLFNANEMDDR